ncbi:restriction endonuclease subunit S [Yersinia enterocolitica]|uniref:Restriction endonuclease subunit S n=1 Tax=Yersinia enterocolitica TaxID=630 RepID=A0AAD2Z3Z4_YEREN|nr:restriction endonuclease subunit S [Yersinia enterocolitica]ELI8101570.1 restriction endonuclease subunit S [Yersinia enterocolitica]HDL7145345.1 restriction endonuclease subunit S [Yersinia enterocolitica]HDL7687733.1 restriction endonuclease subunit S [Yersinia enterocolitica]HDL7791379.1 restriction endonuclease subunit S [Yersinia enterocolitica]
MSDLSYLKKLLDGVEVEWLPLGNITTIKTGQSVNKNMISDNPGEYPVINSGREPLGFIDTWNTDNDPMGITTRGAGVGSVTWQNGKYFRGNLNYSVTINKEQSVNVRYLYHLLLEMQKEIQELCTFDGIPALNASSLKKLLIPIPCPDNPEKSLAIQSEIVRILDKFTALTAELTAELSMRKKQYNYYRDQSLSFDDGEVELKTLGEITRKIASGRNKTRQAEGDFPVYGSTGLLGFTNEPAYFGDLLLVARVGAYAGLVNAVFGHFDVSDNTLIIHPSDSWNARFAFHQLTHMNLNQYAVGAGQPLITGGLLKNLKVPVPSLNEQIRIAKILDKFETMTVSITEGLPREIELRQKQYEYYRDMLFSFPKPDVAEA